MRSPILALHITAGVIGILAGFVAAPFRKGSRWHGMAGNVFVVSMMTMGACASYLAVMKHQMANVFGGLLTIYMVTTAWLTARRRGNAIGVFDWVALLMALAIWASLFFLGVQVATSSAEPPGGVPAPMYFIMGSVALLAAAGDVRMMLRGVSGKHRIARHLWRMCYAFFIGSASLFVARPHLFPVLMQKTGALLLLGFFPLLLMVFWLIRIRFKNAYKSKGTIVSGSEPLLAAR
jgi:hypothetical protein